MNESDFDEQEMINKVLLSVAYSPTAATWENIADFVGELSDPLSYEQINFLLNEANKVFPAEFTHMNGEDELERNKLICNILNFLMYKFDSCMLPSGDFDEVTYDLFKKIMNCFVPGLQQGAVSNIIDIVTIILKDSPSQAFLAFLISVNFQEKICNYLMNVNHKEFTYITNMMIECLYILFKKLPQETEFLISLCKYLLCEMNYDTEDKTLKLVCYVVSNYKDTFEIINENCENFLEIINQTESYQEIKSICKMINNFIQNDEFLRKLMLYNYSTILISKIKYAKNSSKAFRYIMGNIVNICKNSLDGCKSFISLGIFNENVIPFESFLYKKSMISIIQSMIKYAVLPMEYQSTIEDIIITCLETDDEDIISQTLDLLVLIFTKYFTFDIETILENLINSENQEISSKAITFYSSIRSN